MREESSCVLFSFLYSASGSDGIVIQEGDSVLRRNAEASGVVLTQGDLAFLEASLTQELSPFLLRERRKSIVADETRNSLAHSKTKISSMAATEHQSTVTEVGSEA